MTSVTSPVGYFRTIEGKEGQYFGRPISYDGKIQILLANFPKSSLHILQYDDTADEVTQIVSLPLAAVEDCYNLLLPPNVRALL